MSTILPFDIIDQIIDTVGENEDTNLLKKLALVSHCFHQICSKHLFATVELHDALPRRYVASSKKGFIKLLKSRPNVVKHIRKLTYKMGCEDDYSDLPRSMRRSRTSTHTKTDDDLLSPILPNFLRTIPHLNCLTIYGSNTGWNKINPSVTSALFHLMDLPTINHIDLSYICKFPMSSLTPSVNLLRLDLCNLDPLEEEFVFRSEMMSNLREFHTLYSPRMTTKLLHAKRQDGRLAFNFMNLRRLSASFAIKQNIRYLLQNAKLLEKLRIEVNYHQSLAGLHEVLSPGASTLKVLDLKVHIDVSYENFLYEPLEGICEELEALAGNNVLEALSFEIVVPVRVDIDETENYIGSLIQEMEKVLVKPGWSTLRQVSFKLPILGFSARNSVELSKMLQSLPDKYLSHLPKLESVVFNFSSYFVKD